MSKLIVIIGITGNQGHSVATAFQKDPTYRIRGLTRNPTSATAQSLASQGIEIQTCDLDDLSSLTTALAGANLIFSVTNYWEPFFRPDCRATAASKGVSVARHAYDVEYQQGRNIADAAAATVDTLDANGFLVSTLSSARKCSGGKYTDVYHFDSKADVFPGYVKEKWPELAEKMSCVQTGYFMSSFRLALGNYFRKNADGTFTTIFPHSATKPAPQLDVNADLGGFVYAVSKMPPGKDYMAAGTTCSWSEYAATWSKVTGVPCNYEECTLDEMVAMFGDKDAGREIGVMFRYSGDTGYDGAMDVLGFEDLRKAGFDVPMTSLEDYMKKQDWSLVFNQ